jgi:hypothetical protein
MYYIFISIFNFLTFVYRVFFYRMYSVYKLPILILFSIPYLITLVLSILLGYFVLGFKLNILYDFAITIIILSINEYMFYILRSIYNSKNNPLS